VCMASSMRPGRPRGSFRDPIGVNWTIESDVKAIFDAMAKRAGMSGSYFFEQLVLNTELDERGLPAWFVAGPKPEELPIDRP
jgi:hypothetical protein